MYRINRNGSIYCTILIIIFSFADLQANKKYIIEADELMILQSEIIMKSQIGTIEKTNNNDGKEIRKYLDLFDFKEGTPYCAAGIYWCYNEVNKKHPHLHIPVNKTAVASEIFFFAKRKGCPAEFKACRHDLVIWKKNKSYKGHIERIISVDRAGWINTVGFNTSKYINGIYREGVFEKRRNIHHPLMKMKVLGLVGFEYTKVIK